MSETRSYDIINGFEVRTGRTNRSTCNVIKDEDLPFEIRIRHLDPELIQALKEKIYEWLK